MSPSKVHKMLLAIIEDALLAYVYFQEVIIMAKLEIELSNDESERLTRRANERGLPIEDYARQCLLGDDQISQKRQIWEIMAERSPVPDEEAANVPDDLSVNYRHYLYGAPSVLPKTSYQSLPS